MIQQPIAAKQVDGPPPISGSLISQLRFARKYMQDPLKFMADMFEQYGDFVIQWIGSVPIIFTRDPDIIHDVLVTHAASFYKSPDYRDENRGLARFLGQGLLTSEGEPWRRQRKLIQPAMHPRRIEAYADTMVTLTRQTIADWQDGAVIDINRQMMQLTLKIIARTMFSTDVTREVNTISHALDFFQEANNTIDIFPEWVPTPLHMRWPKVMSEFNTVIHEIIQQRRADGAENFNDLLSMLLLAVDEDGEGMS
ncbi:MAG: cytochrome P450, partial [Chloroflexi bacterium]